MNDWKKDFAPQILSRGFDYYEDNAVSIQQSGLDCVNAIVFGRNDYDVSVDIQNGNYYCSCPYFAREGNCKHIAALLYYIDGHPELLIGNDDVDSLVSSLTHDEMEGFLLEELKRSADMLNRLRLFKNLDVNEEYYVNKLKRSFDSSFKVLQFMDNELVQLCEAKQFDLFFKVARMTVDYAEEISNYGEYNTSDEIVVKMENILYKFEDEIDEAMLKEFLEDIILNSDDEGILETFTDIYSMHFDVIKFFDEHYEKVE